MTLSGATRHKNKCHGYLRGNIDFSCISSCGDAAADGPPKTRPTSTSTKISSNLFMHFAEYSLAYRVRHPIPDVRWKKKRKKERKKDFSNIHERSLPTKRKWRGARVT